MQNVILVIHILACLAAIGLVLVQKSEGGGLGIGSGGNSLMSGRGAAGALVRTTMIFLAIFFSTSLALTAIANRSIERGSEVERILEGDAPAAPQRPVDLFDPTVPLLADEPPVRLSAPVAPPATDLAVIPAEPESVPQGTEPANPQ